jgi:hypothetical protein
MTTKHKLSEPPPAKYTITTLSIASGQHSKAIQASLRLGCAMARLLPLSVEWLRT